MDTVGIRELKAHLSRYLKRVRAGARIVVADRGRPIARIEPVDSHPDLEWAHQMVAEGLAHWNGGKPTGFRPVKLKGKGPTASAMVLEDRR